MTTDVMDILLVVLTLLICAAVMAARIWATAPVSSILARHPSPGWAPAVESELLPPRALGVAVQIQALAPHYPTIGIAAVAAYWVTRRYPWAGLLAAAFLLALGGYVAIRLVRSGRSLRLALALDSDVRSGRPLSQYDLFISYRGTTIHTVRPVVDALQAAGVTVWLDEYDVLLEDYDEERLRECIEQGIARCRRAVVFKNQEYLESAYCRRELRLLSERPELHDEVLEIWLGGAESHILASYLDRIWRFLGRDAPAPTVPDLEIGRRFFESRLAGHRFDITGWTVHQAERYEDPGTIFGPLIRRSIFGWRTHMNLIIEPLGEDSIAEWQQRHDLEESVKFFGCGSFTRL